MKARIYVNRYVIGRNRKTGSNDPPISIMKSSGYVIHAREIVIHGPSRIIYNRETPLKSGAWLWMETDAHIEIVS